MAAEGDQNSAGQENGMANANGVALLLVVGEPISDDQKELILERVTKSLCSFDTQVEGFDLNAELQEIAAAAPSGEDGQPGETIIEYSSGKLRANILVNPQSATFLNTLRNFLLTGARHRILLYSGEVLHNSGRWILQDDLLSFASFAAIFKEADVENALKQQEGSVFDIHILETGEWSEAHISKQNFSNGLQVQVNPSSVIQEFDGISQFKAYLSFFVKIRSCKELLQSSDVVGNIRFTRPTLYVFPGAQGDSALLGISGFNLLVNAGYSRKACFWGFTRHLDRIDAMLLTHLGTDNLFGVNSVFERKAIENVHPEIGYVYFNALEKSKHSPNGDILPENGATHKPVGLVVNLLEQANRLVENMKLTGQAPQPCLGVVQNNVLQPLNLYHKVGHGSLDMYILNPTQDSKELKEFLAQWNKNVNNFTSTKNGIPLPSQTSICALLVWKPTCQNEKITRILFPGNTPQEKVFEGLEKLKTLDIFKHASCSDSTLNAPKCQKKPTSAKAASAKAASRASPVSRSSPGPIAKPEPKKTAAQPDKKPPAGSRTSAAASKPAKDAKNKKFTVEKEKTKGKGDKTPSTASSASASKGASPTDTPQRTVTPSNIQIEAAEKQVAASLEPEVRDDQVSSDEPATTPETPMSEGTDTTAELEQTVITPEDVKPDIGSSEKPPEAVTGDLLGDLSAAPKPQPTEPKEEPIDVSELKQEPVEQIQESPADEVAAVEEPQAVPDPVEPPQAVPINIFEPEDSKPEPEVEPASLEKEEVVEKAPVAEELHEEPQPEPQVVEQVQEEPPAVVVEDSEKSEVADISEASQASTETDTPTVQSIDGTLGSPEALPHPEQFDSATFEAVAMQSANDRPEDPFGELVEKQGEEPQELLPEAEQPQADVQIAEAEGSEKETLQLEGRPEKVSISSEDDQEIPTEELRAESEVSQADTAVTPTEPESNRKQSLSEFGIYDDDSTLEAGLKEANASMLAELGIYDEPEADQQQKPEACAEPQSTEADQGAARPQESEDPADVEDDSLIDVGGAQHLTALTDDRENDSLECLANISTEEAAPDTEEQTPVCAPSSNPFEVIDGSKANGEPFTNPFVGMGLNTSSQPNPFDIPDSSEQIGFHGDSGLEPPQENVDRDSLEREDPGSTFDPLKEWGQPMGLPAPDTSKGRKEPGKADGAAAKRGAAAAKAPAKPASAPTRKATETRKPGIPKQGAADAKPAAKKPTSAPAAMRTARKTEDDAAKKTAAAPKKQASSTPSKSKPAAAKPDVKATPARGSAAPKKTAAASSGPSKVAAAPVKLAPVTPFYLDLTYIPGHGESSYVNMEFFRKVRARYYVLSSINPSPALFNALLEAKQTWEDPSLEVTVIPTYDTDILRHWMAANREELSQQKIDFAPSASRCTIQLQDHEASCSAYRLEF